MLHISEKVSGMFLTSAVVSQRRCLLVYDSYLLHLQRFCEHYFLRFTFLPLSEETVGGTSLPPTVTLTKKETIMRKVKLIVHEIYQGKRKSEDVFAAMFLSNAAVLHDSIQNRRQQDPV